MLSELWINNIAIIKTENIAFSAPFTVLTGETGAGKSIILDAIELALGARADKELVRHGEEKASVVTVFTDVPDRIFALLGKYDIPREENLMLRRDISAQGQSTAKINGRPVPVSALKEVGNMLISIHGQHMGMYLLDPVNHINILDSFADTESDIAAYSLLYERMRDIKAEINRLHRDEKEKVRRIEMLKFQIAEINAVSPKAGEADALEEKLKLLANAEKTAKYAKLIYRALYRSEKGLSACDLIERSTEAAEALSDIIGNSAEYTAQLNDIRYRLEDIAETIYKKCDIGTENPSELIDKTQERLEELKKLGRKYGSTVEEILDFRAKAEEDLSEIENSDDMIADLTEELKGLKKEALTAASAISEKRKNAAAVLSRKIVSELAFLEMENVSFEISVKKSEIFLPNGCDEVEFLVSANKGEPLMPLAKIASGGEISRIMLALKCAMADKEKTPTLIFDEIDTGISGKTSYKIGIKMRQSSQTSQIICITHSPQIAAIAAEHLLISKKETEGRTFSSARVLLHDGRVNEIARIIGGEKITEKTLTAAREMLDAAQNILNNTLV
ncbi:MAG: DNA repair protein RecN [Eubacteriales bacterium]